jgi:hypothetical protein
VRILGRDALEKEVVRLRITSGCSAVRCYDETSWIAQKSLAKCAPLMGGLSELAFEPVRYS